MKATKPRNLQRITIEMCLEDCSVQQREEENNVPIVLEHNLRKKTQERIWKRYPAPWRVELLKEPPILLPKEPPSSAKPYFEDTFIYALFI